MRFAKLATLALFFAASCSSRPSSKKHTDGFITTGDDLSGHDFAGDDLSGTGPTGSNVVPMTIDTGPTGAMFASFNVPYISVKICAPGSTTNCATIDHVSVDTGSVGMHVISSTIGSTVLSALPNEMSGGNALTECYTYADGFVYGSVRTADVYIGGELAKNMPFMAMGDPSFSSAIPSECANAGQEEDDVNSFGANGIIGVGLFNPDCGQACTSTTNQGGPLYYGCPTGGGQCNLTGVPLAQQLPNPVSMFATDNNGVLLQLPSISDSGAGTTTGSLIFGIGTQANNALGGATVYTASNDGVGTVNTNFNSQTIQFSFFDSGTTDLSFQDNAIAQCSGDLQSFDCPSTTQSLTAMISGGSGSGMVSFKVANAMTTLAFDTTSNTAFDDIANQESFGMPAFDWGLPFFFGRSMFFAIDGASTPMGAGPYYAF